MTNNLFGPVPVEGSEGDDIETFTQLGDAAMEAILAGRSVVITSTPADRQIDLEELIADAVAGAR